jgi:hypothetical protein
MAIYKIKDPSTGKTISLSGDSPPSEKELEDIFSQVQEVPVQQEPSASPIASTISEYARPTLEVGGGVLGVLAGGGVGSFAGPLTMTGGAVAGGALGTAAGRTAADLIDRRLGLKDPIVSVQQAAQETGNALTFGLASEIGGRGIAKGVGTVFEKAVAPMAGKMATGATEALAAAKRLGINLLPSEITGSRTLGLVERGISILPFTGDVMHNYRLGQIKPLIEAREKLIAQGGSSAPIEQIGIQIQEILDKTFRDNSRMSLENATILKSRLLKKFGSSQTYEELGLSAQEAIKNRSRQLFEISQNLYSKVSEMIPQDATMIPVGLRKRAEEMLIKEASLPASLQNTGTIAVLSDLAQQTEPQSYQALLSIRQRIGQLIANEDVTVRGAQAVRGTRFQGTEESGVLKQLFRAVEEDLGDFTKQIGDGPEKALKVARAFYSATKQTFEDPTIKSIISEMHPEKVLGNVMRPGNITGIRKFRELVGESVFGQAKAKFREGFMKVAEDEALNAPSIRRKISNFGLEGLREVFSKEELSDLIKLPTLIEEAAPSKLVNNLAFKSAVKASPEKVVDFIVKQRNTSNIAAAKVALGEEGFGLLREGFLNELLTKKSMVDGFFSPSKLGTELGRYGDDTLHALLPKDVVSSLKDIGAVGKRIAQAEKLVNNPSGTAQNVIAVSQGMAIITNPIQGLKMVFTPAVLAKAYLSAPLRKWLTTGFTTPLSSPSAQQVASRITAALTAQAQNLFSQETP